MSIQHTMYHVSIKCITNKKKEEIRNQDLVPDFTKIFCLHIFLFARPDVDNGISFVQLYNNILYLCIIQSFVKII